MTGLLQHAEQGGLIGKWTAQCHFTIQMVVDRQLFKPIGS
jgi:hypothetical protein